MMKKRIQYFIAFVCLLVIEVLIALYIHDSIIRPFIGDVLVVIVIYTFVRIWIPEGVKLLPLYVFIFAAAVEGLQYLNIVKLLGLENNTFMRILIGSTFDWKDIICYMVGCILIMVGRLCLKIFTSK
ncbi:MAG: DUF2809 domain-containing protein [Lachnospira sp.]|nr:DUF2809 domain-containing protein [Lachnospira sp.]